MKVKFVPQNVEFEIPAGQSVLHLAQDNGIYIKSVCKGVPSCAECRVRVVEGDHNVLPPSSEELNLIGTGYFLDRRRLSCQLKCFGDITVDMSDQIAKEQNILIAKKKKNAAKDERVEQAVVRTSSEGSSDDVSGDATAAIGSRPQGPAREGGGGQRDRGPREPRRDSRGPREGGQPRPQQQNQQQQQQQRPRPNQQPGAAPAQPQARGPQGPRPPRPQNDGAPRAPGADSSAEGAQGEGGTGAKRRRRRRGKGGGGSGQGGNSGGGGGGSSGGPSRPG